ncbi:MAG: haloacid dehalogenase type II [Firmicutes bacterium HGW-Firmicutes-12]|nr:MAG: haloacid dehalogenase type II [Firmicutes bacterium HGW-Firmicutes-12]
MKDIKAVVFDAYGTLLDVHSVIEKLDTVFPEKGTQISQIWRTKQLEYTWLMSLMGRYDNFFNTTRRALIYALKALKLDFNADLCETILNEYYVLKPFSEVPAALENMQDKKIAILSNGNLEMLNTVVKNAKLDKLIPNILSVDELKIFKPFLGVYQLAPAKLGIPREQTLFVSSNSFDVVGGKVFGFKVAWANRAGNQLDELDVKPDIEVKDLKQLADLIKS